MERSRGGGRWRPPRGRHRLPPEMVARSQRERLHEAAVRVVAEKGFGAMTIGDLTKRARVSRTTFYEFFEGKEHCFLTAYDHAVDAMARRVIAAYESERDWPDRAAAGLAALLQVLAEEPALARLSLVEVGNAGPAAQRRYRAAAQRLTPLFDEGRDYAPRGRRLPANTSRMAIGGVTGLISDELIAGRAEQLPDLLPDVAFATLVPYIGPGAAAREVERLTR